MRETIHFTYGVINDIFKDMKNKTYRHIKIFTSLVFAIIVLLPMLVYAGHGVGPGTGGCSAGRICNPLTVGSFSGFVQAILNIVVKIGIPIAAIAIIFSGFLFVKAQGNPEEITKAKTAFVWSVVGTAILLGAWVFAQAIGTTISAL